MVAGCGSRSNPSSFYLLASIPESESIKTETDRAISLSVGPVRMPAYLDRKQLVIRSGSNALVIREYSRWGEPLQENFQRVLIENLSLLLATPKVYGYDRPGIKETDLQLVIDVSRFDVSKNGRGILIAFWSVNNGQGDRLLRDKVTLTTKSRSMDAADIAGTLNALLTDFSTHIAAGIRTLSI